MCSYYINSACVWFHIYSLSGNAHTPAQLCTARCFLPESQSPPAALCSQPLLWKREREGGKMMKRKSEELLGNNRERERRERECCFGCRAACSVAHVSFYRAGKALTDTMHFIQLTWTLTTKCISPTSTWTLKPHQNSPVRSLGQNCPHASTEGSASEKKTLMNCNQLLFWKWFS